MFYCRIASFFLGPGEGHILRGNVYIKQPQFLNKAGIESGDTSYAKYINMFKALQDTFCDHYEEELISYDRLHECVLDTFPKMMTLSEAVNNRFYNGYVKAFCRDLSLLCSKDLLDCVTESRATFTDSFKLMKMVKKAESISPIFVQEAEHQVVCLNL